MSSACKQILSLSHRAERLTEEMNHYHPAWKEVCTRSAVLLTTAWNSWIRHNHCSLCSHVQIPSYTKWLKSTVKILIPRQSYYWTILNTHRFYWWHEDESYRFLIKKKKQLNNLLRIKKSLEMQSSFWKDFSYPTTSCLFPSRLGFWVCFLHADNLGIKRKALFILRFHHFWRVFSKWKGL